METLGQKMKALRDSKGWSSREAAERCNMSQTAYLMIERDSIPPEIDEVDRICFGYGIKFSDLASASMLTRLHEKRNEIYEELFPYFKKVKKKFDEIYNRQIDDEPTL